MSRYKSREEKQESADLEKISLLTDYLEADHDRFLAARAYKASIARYKDQRRFHRAAHQTHLVDAKREALANLRKKEKILVKKRALYRMFAGAKVRVFRKPSGWPFVVDLT